VAKPTKRRIEGGTGGGTSRTTPKGEKSDSASSSRRYTPPTSSSAQLPSPTWVPVLMFGFFGLGFLAIFLNYTETLPGAPSGWWLIGGLGGILAGIITATQLR
jgi:Cell division protein CrgA